MGMQFLFQDGAMVQAGYLANHDAGRVFRTHVDLDTPGPAGSIDVAVQP